jgi:hypothetical protein
MRSTPHPRRRFRDRGETIYSYLDDILVECPRCGGCASVRLADPKCKDMFDARRLVCASCGVVVEKKFRMMVIGGVPPKDAYFGLPLWLAAPCCGRILWAYNIEHLNLIERYISADLRQRSQPLPRSLYPMKSLVSKLPAWMASAKNRAAVLKAIAKLRQKSL